MAVRPRSRCIAKFYGKTVSNDKIPVNKDQKKDQSYVKISRINVHYIKVRAKIVGEIKVSSVSMV